MMKKKAMTAAESNEKERTQINIRNISVDEWREVRETAKKQGRALWSVFDEMMEDWLKKQGKR